MQTFRLYTRAVVYNTTGTKLLLLKKQEDQKIAAGKWLFPGGTVEFGEDIEETLKRELLEETNLEITQSQLLTTKKIILGDTHWLGVYYLAKVKDETALNNMEPAKHATVEFLEIPSLRNLQNFSDHDILFQL